MKRLSLSISRLALLTALAFPCGAALAAQPGNITDSLTEAYYNNATLQQQRAALRQADEAVPQALAGWRPTVQVSVGINHFNETYNTNTKVKGNKLNYQRDGSDEQVSASLPLFDSGKTHDNVRNAKNSLYAARAQLLATEQQVFLQVVQDYVTVYTDHQVEALDQSYQEVAAQQLKNTQAQFNLGEITYTSVAQAQASLSQAVEQLQVAQGNLQIADENFRQYVGDYPAETLAPPQPLLLPVASKEDAATLAVLNNPAVVAAEFTDAAAKDAVDAAFAVLGPTVTFQAVGDIQNNPSAPNTQINSSEVLGQLTVPIYQGGAEYAAIRAARAKQQQDFAAILDAQRNAYSQATQAWVAFVSSRDAIMSTNDQIKADAIALDGTEREELAGTLSTLDVLNAQQLLLNAQVQQVQNISTLVNNSYTVASAVGKLTAKDLGLPVQEYDDLKYYDAVKNAFFGTGELADRRAGVASDGTFVPAAPAKPVQETSGPKG